MRYISQHSNFTLYRNNGEIANVGRTLLNWGQQGELGVGDLTLGIHTSVTAADSIDVTTQSPTTANIQRIHSTDLDGSSTNTYSFWEMCGMGTLSGVDAGGTTLTNIEDGWRDWYEAPTASFSGTTANFFPAHKNLAYKIKSGTCTYAGKNYTAGKVVESDGTTIAATGTFTAHRAIPRKLYELCGSKAMVDGLFALEHMETGNESTDYYQDDGGSGYEPLDDLTCTDANYIGTIL